ncbi:MAG: ATP-binding protein, partial [Pseudomonadales bacterium]
LATTMLPLARKNNNQLLVEADENIPQLYSDAVKFRQIFINLLSNACKFTRDGKITVQASYAAHNKQLVYHISDTGIGMSKTALKNIFEAFVQADAETSHKYGGTGLGLAICKQFIELMHGTLDVRSAPGEGTTFTVVLPAQPVQPKIGELISQDDQQELSFVLTPPVASDVASTILASDTEPGALALVALLKDSDNDFAESLQDHCQTMGYSPSDTRLQTLCEHHRPDFLCALLGAESKVLFASGWLALSRSLQEARASELPALLVFGESASYPQACELAARFDYSNRKRLTIPVRQHNPVARRGNAVLIGFANEEFHGTGEALRNSLEKEAWQCEVTDSDAEGDLSAHADLVFFALQDNADLLYWHLIALREKLAHPDSEELVALPGIFLVTNQNSSRVLDSAAIEIELTPPV